MKDAQKKFIEFHQTRIVRISTIHPQRYNLSTENPKSKLRRNGGEVETYFIILLKICQLFQLIQFFKLRFNNFDPVLSLIFLEHVYKFRVNVSRVKYYCPINLFIFQHQQITMRFFTCITIMLYNMWVLISGASKNLLQIFAKMKWYFLFDVKVPQLLRPLAPICTALCLDIV